MNTKIINIDKDNIDGEALKEAGQIIRDGGLVAFPTETVYGLGANALDAQAAMKVYAAKGRPSDNPLIAHRNAETIGKENTTGGRKINGCFLAGTTYFNF